MYASTMLSVILLCAALGQQRAPEVPDALRGVKPPPTNPPLVRPAPTKAQRVSPALPKDDLPRLLIVRGEQVAQGEIRLEGKLSIEPGAIILTPSQGESLRILYRLPKALPAPSRIPELGKVSIREFSGPQGADRKVIVGNGRELTFAEVWQTSPKPLDVALTNEVSLVQQAAPEPKAEYSVADLIVKQKGEVLGKVPVGSATRIQTGAGVLVVYVEVSHRYRVPEGEDHAGDRYILQGWVTGQE